MRHLLVVLSFFAIATTYAQINNTEILIVSEDNIALEDVIAYKSSNVIATSNDKGILSFKNPSTDEFILRLTLKDFKPVSLKISPNTFKYTVVLSKAEEELNTVILASTYQKESKVLIPTTSVTAESIAEGSPIDLVDAINETSGVYIQRGAINTNRITIRGIGSRTLFGTNKIRAYFNGFPITNGVGETAIDIFNTQDIASIEIIKGPKATQYGANLGGTLLLNSKDPKKDGLAIKNTVTIGSFELFKESLSLNLKEDKLSLHLNADHQEHEGYRENNRYNRNALFINTSYTLNKTFTINGLVQHINNFAQIPSSLNLTDFNEAPTQAAFTWAQSQGFEDNRQTLVGLGLSSNISDSWSNATNVYYSYLDHYEPRPFNILAEITNTYGVRTVFANTFNLNKKSANLSFGAEFNQDHYVVTTTENLYEDNNGNGSLEGSLLSDNTEIRSQLQLFGTSTLPITEKLTAEIGLHLNKASYNLDDNFNEAEANTSADREFDIIVAPNLSLLYKLNNTVTTYLNISRGFNYPSLEETLTPDGIINTDIGPEIGWNYEVGTTLSLLKQRLHINAAAYLLSVNDLLVAERVGNDQFIGRNAGQTDHKGIEISIDYKQNIVEQLQFKTFVNAEFNAHKFIDFVDGDSDFSGNDLTGVPSEKINAGISLQHTSGFFFSSQLQYIGEQPITDANTLYAEDYTTLRLSGGYKQSFNEKLSLEVKGGVNNVTDTAYASSILINASSFGNSLPRYYYPGLPRHYFASLSLNYNF